VDEFGKIVRNHSERRWEPTELSGGKLCEIVHSIVKGKIDGNYPARASKPPNMFQACRQIEQTSGISRSLKIQIPRVLVALYEIRNNRNVGHVGGEVDPNHMDAVCVLQMSKWLLAELVRIFHTCSVQEATAIVDALVEREVPLVWKVGERTRVLDANMSMKEKMLVLLHASAEPMQEQDLVASIEHSNPSVFRRDVLRAAHKRRLVEYDEGKRLVTISPLGIEAAEKLVTDRS
jgi:hypothetical protein